MIRFFHGFTTACYSRQINATFESFNFGKCPKMHLEHFWFIQMANIVKLKLLFDRNYLFVINIVSKNIPIIVRSKFNCIASFFRTTMLSNSNLLSRKEMRALKKNRHLKIESRKWVLVADMRPAGLHTDWRNCRYCNLISRVYSVSNLPLVLSFLVTLSYKLRINLISIQETEMLGLRSTLNWPADLINDV